MMKNVFKRMEELFPHRGRGLALVILLPFCNFQSEGAPFQNLYTTRDISIEYFNVHASSCRELEAKLKLVGPLDPFQRRRFAVTRWNIHWNWPKNTHGEPLFLETYTNTKIKVILPKWIPTTLSGLDNDFQGWRKVYTALINHEFDHAARAMKTGEEIRHAIRRAAAHTPDFNESKAHAIARRIIRANNEWDENYDRETRHGVTQGIDLSTC